MGHLDENMNFVPPLSYLEAQQMVKEEIKLFLEFDEIAGKTLRRIHKKKGK